MEAVCDQNYFVFIKCSKTVKLQEKHFFNLLKHHEILKNYIQRSLSLSGREPVKAMRETCKYSSYAKRKHLAKPNHWE